MIGGKNSKVIVFRECFGYIKRDSLPETDYAKWHHKINKRHCLSMDYRQPILSGLPPALLTMDAKY